MRDRSKVARVASVVKGTKPPARVVPIRRVAHGCEPPNLTAAAAALAKQGFVVSATVRSMFTDAFHNIAEYRVGPEDPDPLPADWEPCLRQMTTEWRRVQMDVFTHVWMMLLSHDCAHIVAPPIAPVLGLVRG